MPDMKTAVSIQAAVLAVLVALIVSPAVAEDRANVTFLGVYLDPDTKKADEKLREYFRKKAPLEFETQDMEYGAAISTLVQWDAEKQGPLMARVTPYVYVAAEMMGADLDILGTYLSKKTGAITYHSYFVVNESFEHEKDDLESFQRYLRERETPARFVFHDKFSTSSYFLPSLYFQKNGIFSVKSGAAVGKKFIAISSNKPAEAASSTDLVTLVSSGHADFAAVWDGTKDKFKNDPGLRFIRLPYTIPNDLLVLSRNAGGGLKDKIVKAIRSMNEDDIGVGDFAKWIDMNEAFDARKALAGLRWLAKVPPPPVTVKIRRAKGEKSGMDEKYLDAARQAVRLSGTELVLYDEDFHSQFDILWTFKKAHDDSIIITSEYTGAGLAQEFYVSFKKDDMESLTSRIGAIIHTRMHRIRYIWAFDDELPRVLRDVEFSLPEGTVMKAQKITWSDFNKNEYVMDAPFDVKAVKGDFHSFQLESDGFPRKEGGTRFDFDPMSNKVFRVFLVRTQQKRLAFQVFTLALIGLFFLAAAFALLAVLRKTPGHGRK